MNPLPPNFIKALSLASTKLETVVELELDGGTIAISRNAVHGTPILQSTSRLLHKLQPTFGKSNVAKMDIALIDRSEWGPIVADNYIKNRRAGVKIGPRDGNSSDFYTFFTGLITDFSIKGEVLSIEIRDDLYVAKIKVPAENDTKTQTLAFQNTNPIDIKKTLLQTHAGIPSTRIDTTAFTNEKNIHYLGWYFERVLTEPVAVKQLINELDEQTLSSTFTDGDKITMKAFAPPAPGQNLLFIDATWQRGSLEIGGAMNDNFFNKCVVYFDYDESGSDGEENFDSIVIVADAASQGAAQWDEVARKEIKSKWLRSYTIAQPTNITGVVVYHCNPQNGAGNGTLAYNATNKTLSWTAPGDTAGDAVTVDKDGKFQLLSGTATKYIRVVVTSGSLPGTNQSDNLAISTLPGPSLATLLASHWVARYADPQAGISFSLDLAGAVHQEKFLQVADILKISSGSIITKGLPGWDQERIFLTSVRPDYANKQVKISGIQTSFKKRYGFIGPASMTGDYDSASDTEKEYGFIGDANNQVGLNNEDGYYIW